MKKIANFVILCVILSFFASLAGIMYGHKYYNELIAGFISEYPSISYEIKNSGMFSEDAYITVSTKSDVGEFFASYLIKVKFFPFHLHTDIYYVNSTADPIFLDLLSVEGESPVLSQDLRYQENDLSLEMEISSHKYDISGVEIQHSPIKMKFKRTLGNLSIEFFMDRLVSTIGKVSFIAENVHFNGEQLKFNNVYYDHLCNDGTTKSVEMNGLVIKKESSSKFYAEANRVAITSTDQNYADNGEFLFEYPNADVDIATTIWTDYNFSNFSFEDFVYFISKQSVKLYVFGGRDDNGESFDIVYSSGSWCSFCGNNEGVLRIFAGSRLLNLLDLDSKYSLHSNADNVNLLIHGFESGTLSER